MSAAMVEIGALFGLACVIAFFVVPTVIAAHFGLHWWCLRGSLLFVAVTFVLLMLATYLRSHK